MMNNSKKNEAHRVAQAAHRLALVEGRAVRTVFYDDVHSRASVSTFPTVAAAELYAAEAVAEGLDATVLKVSLAEQAASLGLPGVPEHWLS